MNKQLMKAYVNAINHALVSRREALQMELAVSFAVLLETKSNKRLSREIMIDVYSQSGYQCGQPGTRDWLMINRHIRASFALFDFIGEPEVVQWAGDLTKAQLLDAIVRRLEPLKLGTVNEVLTICEKVKPQRAAHHVEGIRVETEHIHFTIPASATRMELMELAAKIMAMAQSIPFEQPSVAQPAEGVELEV